jgi:hypothetical protein
LLVKFNEPWTGWEKIHIVAPALLLTMGPFLQGQNKAVEAFKTHIIQELRILS